VKHLYNALLEHPTRNGIMNTLAGQSLRSLLSIVLDERKLTSETGVEFQGLHFLTVLQGRGALQSLLRGHHRENTLSNKTRFA
jgi:hypothetical protein